MKVDGTIYEIAKFATGWFVCLDGVSVGGPYRTKGEALSVAIARTGAVLVGGGLDRSAA